MRILQKGLREMKDNEETMGLVLSKNYSQIFCERLKELRKQNNLTQLDFAAIFNVSKGTVSTW